MLFIEIFWTFLKIGLFTFGGGYAMVALIQNEVTESHHWMTQQEYTDILAVSQMTPGPIGINTATYAGYTAVAEAGYGAFGAVCGSLLASLAVVLLPVVLMVLVVTLLRGHRDNPVVARVFALLRLVVVGLVASAAIQLVNPASFGTPGLNVNFVASVLIFAAVFVLSLRRKSPIWLILSAGAAGVLLYGLV